MPAAQTIEVGPPHSKEAVWAEQDAWAEEAPTSLQVRQHVEAAFGELLDLTHHSAGRDEYEAFERQVVTALFRLGRLLIALFLCLGHERLEQSGLCPPQPGEERKAPKARLLGTFFGKVRYWRTYLYRSEGGGGRFPLDEKLGLLSDGFSLGLLGRAVQLATKMSYEAASTVLWSFLSWSMAPSSIEQAVLGLGRYTGAWFEQAPPPENDGEVLIIQADSKATPTATEQELDKRRGKRAPNPYPSSQRHRGRARREERGPKTRRKKGDKSKNGKMATIVVMYTLGRGAGPDGKPALLGPHNRRQYASYAPKRHALAIARREADKRGFTRGSGKLVQVITDGDEQLARGVAELFPEAKHTLDVAHALEYLWDSAACLFPEGSEELLRWVQRHKKHLYAGEVYETVIEGDERIERVSSASKRQRLAKNLEYLAKRADMMNYAELREQDLEIGSGIVEGAVRYVISQRFDEGGMRWIKERAEALLQLRCIELNGDWDRFIAFVHAQLRAESAPSRRPIRLLQDGPQPLPTFGLSCQN